MKLPTAYLPRHIKSAVRFVVIGLTGTCVQTWFFLLAMYLLSEPAKDTTLYYVAFGIGFFLEMIPNYVLSNWYTFGTRPTLKNAEGFILARGVNLIIQFTCLPLFIKLLPMMEDGWISMIVIFVAGIINYFILLIFFNNKNKENNT